MTVLRYMTDYMTDPHRHDGRRDSLGVWVPVARADDGILLMLTIVDDPSLNKLDI